MCTISAIWWQDLILGIASVDKGGALDVSGAAGDCDTPAGLRGPQKWRQLVCSHHLMPESWWLQSSWYSVSLCGCCCLSFITQDVKFIKAGPQVTVYLECLHPYACTHTCTRKQMNELVIIFCQSASQKIQQFICPHTTSSITKWMNDIVLLECLHIWYILSYLIPSLILTWSFHYIIWTNTDWLNTLNICCYAVITIVSCDAPHKDILSLMQWFWKIATKIIDFFFYFFL